MGQILEFTPLLIEGTWMTIKLTVVSAVVCLFVAWICLQTNIQHISRNEMTVGVTPIPKAWISVWITYGFASSGLHFARNIILRPATA